jgi:hypothetical protein
MKAPSRQMRFRDALRVRSAEYWLKLGEPYPALLELERLPDRAQSHPWTDCVRRQAFRTAHQPQKQFCA